MSKVDIINLSDRQKREIEYHRRHAEKNRQILDQTFSFDVIEKPALRWWNAYWTMFALLANQDLKEKKVLVVGCGFGDDALRLAKLGAEVSAFDLSEDSLSIARQLASRECLKVSFDQMPSEALRYSDNYFDYIVARDILHHVDIPKTMVELVRVAQPNALFVINEIYSHSTTDRIRQSSFVTKYLYPRMRDFIYGRGKEYITEDERKLSECDLAVIQKPLCAPETKIYFNFVVTRLIPEKSDLLAKADRVALWLLRPLAHLLAGRVIISARIRK
jgi:ubiquinone/menaquinone biosynthesis C-methylase UbiE